MTGPNGINSVPLSYFLNGANEVQQPQPAPSNVPQSQAQDAQNGAPAPQPQRAGDLMQKLDVLMIKAAKASTKSVDGKTLKKDLQKLVDDGALTKDELNTLASTANAAKKALSTLNSYNGRQLASAFKPDGTLDRESPAGKAISEAIETQNQLSDELAKIDKRLDAVQRHADKMLEANPNFKGVDPALQNAINDMRLLCDRRATEISRLSYQMRDFAVQLAAQGQDADPNIKAILAAKVDELLPRQALAMHGTSEALTSLNKEIAAKLKPLAERIDAFRSNPKATIDDTTVLALQSDLNTMKAAITDIKNHGIDVGSGKVLVAKDIIQALEKELDNTEKLFSTANRDVVQRICTNFIATAESLFSENPALEERWSQANPNGKALFRKRGILIHHMKEFVNKALDKNVSDVELNNEFKNLWNAFVTLAKIAYDVKPKNPKDPDSKSISNMILRIVNAGPALTQLSYLLHSARSSKSLLTGSEAMSLFTGKLSVSALVETRIRGLNDADVDEANDDANIISSQAAGSGNAGTVYELQRSNGEKVIFKGETESRIGLFSISAGAGNAHAQSQQTVNLNIASRKAAEALGMGSMIVKYTAGTRKGIFGFYMDKAPGTEARRLIHKNRKPSAEKGLTLEEIRALPSDQKKQVQADLMRELNRLQWLDLMTGQMDRHNNNYFIHIDKDTRKVTVTGIDNDAGYSKYRTGAVTYTLDENRTKSFKKCLENIGKPLGFHRDPGEFVDRLLKDPGITIRDDGNITIDASKVKDKTLIYALTQAQGVQTTAIPDKIDRQTYDAFMALKSGPKREEYLASIRPRLSEESYKAAVSRLDDVIAHAERLQAEGKVIENEPNGWLDVTEPPFENPDVTVENSLGESISLGRKNSFIANNTVCPSFFSRDYLDKLFA